MNYCNKIVDYIDPMHHAKIAGQPSYNLDLWMSDKQHVQSVFEAQSEKGDVSVTEGVMGLFDGAKKDDGSSAAIARLLGLPIVLVVDASSMAYSVAPLLYGFKNFDKNINLAGVIFNKVASKSHFQFLDEAAKDAGVEVFGYVPRDSRLLIESRHLGLHLPYEHKNLEMIETVADLLENYVDIDKLLKLSAKEKNKSEFNKPELVEKKLTIAMAKDEAFNFTYRSNSNVLNELGTVVEFSPVHDSVLPDVDLVWLPGGYPELFVKELAANKSMKQAIRRHIKAGKALVAECGGMMYLGNNIITKKSECFEMAGIFDFETSFAFMKLHLGYRELIKDGFSIKGHEFHYSNLTGNESANMDFETKTARGKTINMPVYRTQNCWASYMHLYLGEKEKMKQLLREIGL